MKVVFVLSCLTTGGLEMQTITLANSLYKNGFCEVQLIVLRPVKTLEYLLDPGIPVNYIIANNFYDQNCIKSIRSLVVKEDFDFVFAEETYAGLYCYKALIGLRQSKSMALVFHTTVLPNIKEKIKNLYYKRMANKFPFRIFVSNNQMSYWIDNYNIKQENSLVIHNGIDTKEFSIEDVDMEAVDTIKKKYDIADKTFTILKCGRLIKEKNDVFLIKAIEQLLISDKWDIKVLLVGDGPERKVIEKYVSEKGLKNVIRLIGNVRDVRPYIVASDMGTLPSYATETFSLAALEQMALCKPMLLSNIGGASEMIKEATNGYLFNNLDINEYTEKIEIMIESKASGRLADMGIQARELVVDNFSREAMVRKYMDFIRSAI